MSLRTSHRWTDASGREAVPEPPDWPPAGRVGTKAAACFVPSNDSDEQTNAVKELRSWEPITEKKHVGQLMTG